MKRALIVEKMPCHQEIIPSWVWALTRLGYTVDIAAVAPPHRHIGASMRELMEMTGFTFVVASSVDSADYDIVVNNSLYPEDVVPHIMQGGPKVLSVLHTLPAETLGYKDFRALRSPNHALLALGPHMHHVLSDPLHAMHSAWTPPIFFGDPPPSAKKRHLFIVQGTMERFRRNYGCLAALANHFAPTHAFEVELMGDGGSGVVAWLSPQLESVHRGRVKALLNAGYTRFIDEIRAAGWVMPCVDDTFEHGYFDRKITSSVMMAVGNCTPLLLHRKLAEIYGLENGVNCLVYVDEDSLKDAFQAALEMPEKDYYRMVAGTRTIRQAWLDQLYQGMKLACASEN